MDGYTKLVKKLPLEAGCRFVRKGRGVATVPIFLLVPQVKLPKRLDLARNAERAHDAVPGLIVAKWVETR